MSSTSCKHQTRFKYKPSETGIIFPSILLVHYLLPYGLFYVACFTMSLLAPMAQALRLHLFLPILWFNPKTSTKLLANRGKLLSTLNKREQENGNIYTLIIYDLSHHTIIIYF